MKSRKTKSVAGEFVWVYKDGEQWQLFNSRDQLVLTANVAPVLVLGGRFEADVANSTMKKIYESGSSDLAISKSWWFVDDVPFLERDCCAISFWANSAVSRIEPLTLSDGRRIFRKANDESLYLEGASILSPYRVLFGCPPLVASSDNPDIPCTHLLVCVHGIGESLWSRKSFGQNPFEKNCDVFRSLLADSENSSSRIEVLHIHWYHILAESGYAKRIEDISLPTIPLFRQLANEAISDVIFYLNEQHKTRVLTHVRERFVHLVETFKTRNPTFAGKVSLVGHSLGSVICFDLLTEKDSPIAVENLFLLGSPLSMFWTATGTDPLPLKTANGRVFNIMQPNDPVAYRIEPYLIPLMQTVEPVLIPNHKTGGLNTHVQLKHTASSIMGLFAAGSETPYMQRFAELYSGPSSPKPDSPVGIAIEEINRVNKNTRIDWQVQESFIGGATEYADAIVAHTSYFDNRDVAQFIAKQIKESSK